MLQWKVGMSLKTTQLKWDTLALADPLWAVLTWDDKKQNSWDSDEFFATGEREVEELLGEVKRLGIPVRSAIALDFGCGVGRLTRALSRCFDVVYGVDISKEMLHVASQAKPVNVEYFLNDSDHLRAFKNDFFDVIISMITLQHIETKYIKRYITEFLRILKPGGVAIFQLPSHPVEIEQNIVKRIKYFIKRLLPYALVARHEARISKNNLFLDMHGIRPSHVERIIRRHGGVLLQRIRDHNAGSAWVSFRYIITKR